MNEYFIPALFISCTSKDISYFGKSSPPEPEFKFRYYDFGMDIPVAVIEVFQDFGQKKAMNLYLHPGNRFVQQFLKTVISTKWLSCTYFENASNIFISSFVKLGFEELNWFRRSTKKSKKLVNSTDLYQTALKKIMKDQQQDKIRYYLPENNDKRYLAEHWGKLIIIAK